jgi:hypothetical protein
LYEITAANQCAIRRASYQTFEDERKLTEARCRDAAKGGLMPYPGSGV